MRLRHFAWLTLLCSTLSGAEFTFAADASHFDSDGVDIRYFSGGQGDALILIHGFSGSAETAWIRSGNFDALVAAGFRVIALDNRGHGGSDKPHDPTSYGVNMAEDVRRLLDHLDLERAHVVGYSMGGKIANTFRARHPQRVITLTLGGYGWPWRGQAATLEESRERLAQRTFGPGNDVDALAAYRVNSNDLVPSETYLRENRTPTLSIVGTEDTAVSRDSIKTLRETMAHVEAVDMPGTHAGPDGALYKSQFGDEVVSFIRRNSPTTAFSWPGENWQTSTPEQEGLDVQAIAQLDEEFRTGKHGYVDSMLIIRNGRMAFEAYYENDYQAINAALVTGESGPWNYYDWHWHPFHMGSDLHTVQSTTKSFMSALVGIAIERGELPGVSATLGDLLPARKIADPQKAAITLHNILTMTPGFEWEEDVSYWDPRNDAIRVELTDDWVAYLLNKPLAHDQGSTYKYNSTNTQLMSEMVSTASGRALNEYADELLFGPIGIKDYFWKDAPEGFKDVAGGLYLTPRDLARFALLYEREGEWDGRQIVPAEWVARSATPYVADTAPEYADFNVGYGYQWWVYNDGSDGKPFMYGSWGWGGQFALIVPELDLIGVFTGWNIYEGQDNEYAFRLFYDRVVVPAAHASAGGE